MNLCIYYTGLLLHRFCKEVYRRKSLNDELLTNDIHLHFVLVHCINSHTGMLDWTKAHVSCCSAKRENVRPTKAALPSLSKHCRLARSIV